MNTVQRIAKNMAVLFIARIVSMLFGFFYVMYTARYLGPANYGILAFALALNGIFGVITNFGLDPLTVREVARDKSLAKKYLANGIVLKLMSGSLTFLIVFLVVNLLGYPEITRKVVYIITISTIIAGISNLFNDIYQAFERMEFMSIGQVLQSALSLVFAITAIRLGLNVVYFAMIYLTVNLIALGYHIIITTWKFLKPKIEVDLSFWKGIVREAWPFALSSIFVSIYFWVDSVMLSYMKGDEVVGIYNAAYRLVYVLLFIPSIYFATIYPVLSRMYLESKEDLKFAYNRSLKYFAVLGIFIGVVTVLFSREVVLLIYGKAYEASIPALKILIWAVVFSFMAHSTLYTLNSINRQIIYTKATALGAILNFILNIFAIQKLSYIGASITTVVTEALGFFIMFVYLKVQLKESLTSYLWVVKLFPIVFGSIGVYYLILKITQNFIILLSAYTLGYGIGILLLKVIDNVDFNLLKKALKGG